MVALNFLCVLATIPCALINLATLGWEQIIASLCNAWVILGQLASSDNKATDVDIIITLEETLASGTAISSGNASVTSVATYTLLTELTTSKTNTGDVSGTLATDIFENDAGIYGSISSGGAGDVRDAEAASDGLAVVTAATGTARQMLSRVHWLG